jgi:hypothetical protein
MLESSAHIQKVYSASPLHLMDGLQLLVIHFVLAISSPGETAMGQHMAMAVACMWHVHPPPPRLDRGER